MWEINDKQNYYHHQEGNVGQICNDSFAKYITEYASNNKYKTRKTI
jgi:hypothetical protein